MEDLPVKAKQSSPTNGLIRSTISGQLQIRHLKNSVPIAQTLVECYKLVGLREKHFPSIDPKYNEAQYLIYFIVKNYGGMVAKELKLAFELLVQRKLNIKEEQISPYDNFSPEYLGRILTAYNQFKSKALAGTIKSLTEEPKKHSRKLYYQEQLFKPYAKLLKGRYVFSDVDEIYLYRSLDSLGIELASLEEKKDFMKAAEEGLKPKYRETAAERKQRIIDRARSMCFQTWIKGLTLNETDIKEVILPLIKEL